MAGLLDRDSLRALTWDKLRVHTFKYLSRQRQWRLGIDVAKIGTEYMQWLLAGYP